MSAKLIKDHTHRQNQLRRDNDKRRKETVQALGNYTDALAETLNAGVGQVFANERELRQQASKLDRQTARTMELTKQWLALSGKINGAIKELGMVTHFCKVIEGDARELAETLRVANEPANET
ncbi:GCN5-like 1 [Syncephalis pseudoplumigaleata]|uniref:Biogenesis of lysosome-related organelles complex 1 subunit 1 n=1 Tax=Syncephalis pseudoplumigaleata TaxID=1712513 RepID=A0A4P9Z7T4_9FUNG|nr:GCN5-like 1 [Syncephalis pseudoplumigaleata]|eukprot:RKP27981.1 GCN5-like 1 [Syncephalis pseudoplumigaleata]